jgi:hypothetical protein
MAINMNIKRNRIDRRRPGVSINYLPMCVDPAARPELRAAPPFDQDRITILQKGSTAVAARAV